MNLNLNKYLFQIITDRGQNRTLEKKLIHIDGI